MTESGTVITPPRPAPSRPGPVVRLLLVPVRLYRAWISPVLPPTCRFEPSCSAYAVDALTTHGALRGTWLTLRRLLRCGPWHPGGWDPVPERKQVSTDDAALEVTTERALAEGPLSRWQGSDVANGNRHAGSPAGVTAARAKSREAQTRPHLTAVEE